MASTRRGIGRGLAAILPETEATAAGELRELPVELIKPNPSQPRTNFEPEALAALAASIEASGVVQPMLPRASRMKSRAPTLSRPVKALRALRALAR